MTTTDPSRLPTLDELRTRRKEAMLRASRQIVPAAAVIVALEAPALVAFWMVSTGRLTLRIALPTIAASMIASFICLTALIVAHVKRNVPRELRRAGLICHVCGEPLVVRPSAVGTRTIPSDPRCAR